ncbi:hypothetical protein EKO04_002343 [Ascochyta lentis]|uniref:Uncharacterized protein n=1 Tax=Ascochyta lentis TaxID=205686 RepID=A0A8H7JAW5_9PLEO|nr:hypothetical protein EKO04_002343 [Ascochyta lentis]
MPPKATAHKTYSADVVAAVLMATGTTSLSMKHYEVMSSLDGVKTASAFQHDFRDVLAKAKELKARIDEGEVFEPVQPTKKRVNMAKATDSPAGGQKAISADSVSVLLMALGCTGISKAQLEMMSALDGTRTASSFEHQFRSIMAKARELKKRVEDGEKFTPVQPGTKRGGTATPASSKKRKGDDADDTPTKKPKAAAKPRGKKAQAQTEHPQTPQADDDDLPDDMEDFIKSEKQWEDEHIV